MRVLVSASLFVVCCDALAAHAQEPSAPATSERTGEQIFYAACAACHGPDGKGQPKSILGFEPPSTFPDFTDCAISSAEPDVMWLSIVHRGGRARGESHLMPAFEEALGDADIERVVEYLHSLCTEPGWPRGDLNFPRAFFTEKAFPENEAVLTVGVVPNRPHTVENLVNYEHRIGKRAQFEAGVPITLLQSGSGQWAHGLGDINFGYKYALYDNHARGSIVSAGGEVTLPTGKETEGLGEGLRIYEGFAMLGQALPGQSFIQLHTGFERPSNHDIASNAVYWRTAIGKTFAQDRWGRNWSPMLEVLGTKELADGAATEWDLVPQMQVTLSVFQHVRLDVGVRLPMTERETRNTSVLAYFLWDFADAGLFEFWRAH